MPRGGRRPGAGAPLGNTNALKTGAHSGRVKAVVLALMHDPETREVLLHLGASARARNTAIREVGLVMARFLRDHPAAAHLRDTIGALADKAQIDAESDAVLAEIAIYEQTHGRDAFTGRRLTRPARRSPQQLLRTARLLARLRATNLQLDRAEHVRRLREARFVPVMEAWFTPGLMEEVERADDPDDNWPFDAPPA
jgi:hypothetical protein